MEKKIAVKKMTKRYTENGENRAFTATFELHDLGQGAYFSVTGEDRKVGRRIDACGCMHDDIIRHFPEMEKYIKWHLVNVKSGPMHYIANSLYWAGFSGWCDGKKDSPPNMDYLKSTCIYGALPSDKKTDLSKLNKEELTAWLNGRFDELIKAFDKDMKELFS